MKLENKVKKQEGESLIHFLAFTCQLNCVKENNYIPFTVFTNHSNVNLTNVITKISFYITKITLLHENLLRVNK